MYLNPVCDTVDTNLGRSDFDLICCSKFHDVAHFCCPYWIFILDGKYCIIFVITHIGLAQYEREEYMRIFVATSHTAVYSWVDFVTDDTFMLYPDLYVAFM